MATKTKKGKLLKTTYKVWTTIEVHKEYENGETYKDIPKHQQEPRSLGTFSTLNLAEEQINLLGNMHQNDGDADIE